MQENLVIVESPAKAKKIEEFLGKDYKVMSSYGHIRDLKKKELSINEQTMEPDYEIPDEKKKLVTELKATAKKAKKIWLASDEDREGEAISWHLCEVLGLDEEKTSRIVFHEITKPAILDAIQHPRHLDMNLVNAQQARRVLDRLVGFKLSPVLWRKVKPALSAGRVQSVAVRLIVEREREIQKFKSESYYRVSAIFALINENGNATEVKAELDKRFKTHEEVEAFLEKCKDAKFTVEAVNKKPLKRTPAPPFTTSTLQQEAARKLGFTVSQTMMIAQKLYESGRITYMRTDSVNLSTLCTNASKDEIIKVYGSEYSQPRAYHTHSKGAQEAHEAIRPTYMNETSIDGTSLEKRLDATHILPDMKEGDELHRREITATEKFSAAPLRYTEASLVKKLEDLGIGRPSTYAPTISTIQQREYVQKGDKKGVERSYTIDSLKGIKVTQKVKKEIAGNEKGKLLPTDIGIVVNDFLMENFPGIMDYNFTANVEQKFDDIAEGKTEWNKWMKTFDKDFEPEVSKVMNARSEHKAGERELGTDPKTGKPVFVKIGRFGPVAQIGSAEDKDKPLFAQLPSNLSIETITLEEALELFKLPRELGEFEGTKVSVGTGRFGPYVQHNRKYVSIPKGEDPMTITLDRAIELIQEKRETEQKRHLKSFAEDEKLELLNGKYGPYIAYDGKNYRLPKNKMENVEALTYEECMTIIKEAPEPKTARRRK